MKSFSLSALSTFDSYMAPERINPPPELNGYDIRSDVWSLGITMCELSIGKFPYKESGKRADVFHLIKQLCNDDPPRLPEDCPRFTSEYRDFISVCLQKDYKSRPYYASLVQHAVIIKYQNENISDYVCRVLDEHEAKTNNSA